jgi:hypothetical protein
VDAAKARRARRGGRGAAARAAARAVAHGARGLVQWRRPARCCCGRALSRPRPPRGQKTLAAEGIGGLYKGVAAPLTGQMFFRCSRARALAPLRPLAPSRTRPPAAPPPRLRAAARRAALSAAPSTRRARAARRFSSAWRVPRRSLARGPTTFSDTRWQAVPPGASPAWRRAPSTFTSRRCRSSSSWRAWCVAGGRPDAHGSSRPESLPQRARPSTRGAALSRALPPCAPPVRRTRVPRPSFPAWRTACGRAWQPTASSAARCRASRRPCCATCPPRACTSAPSRRSRRAGGPPAGGTTCGRTT